MRHKLQINLLNKIKQNLTRNKNTSNYSTIPKLKELILNEHVVPTPNYTYRDVKKYSKSMWKRKK